ncbi:MAG TPA: site-2 protease family protein [Candidatus Saccharimonadales bacterium]|jgi:Zn-dependent protease
MQFDPVYIALVIAIVLISMTIHEAMHGYVAFWLGDDTAEREGRLTLNPIKHIDPFLTIMLPLILAIIGAPIFGGAKPVPFNPNRVKYEEFGAALVGLAGPLTNLVFAFVLFGIYALLGTPADFAGQALLIAVYVNLGFFIFNMLPIPPLDGSRLLYALAPDGARRVMEVIEQQGLLIVFAIVFLFSSQIGVFILAAREIILRAFSALFGL